MGGWGWGLLAVVAGGEQGLGALLVGPLWFVVLGWVSDGWVRVCPDPSKHNREKKRKERKCKF